MFLNAGATGSLRWSLHHHISSVGCSSCISQQFWSYIIPCSCTAVLQRDEWLHLMTRTWRRQPVWVIPFHSVQVTNYGSRGSLWPHPLWRDRFPTVTCSYDPVISTEMRYERHLLWGQSKKKTAAARANVLATINHTSVASWMHTNLYVLDLCGRSNLTKTIQVLVVGARDMINESYLHKSKRASEKKRGDRARGHSEMTNRWWETVRGERDWKKGDYLIHYPTTPLAL